MLYLLILIVLGLPIVAAANWIVKLMDYCQAKKENKKNPDTHSTEDMKHIKLSLIISSVLVFVAVAVLVGLVVTFYMGIAYM